MKTGEGKTLVSTLAAYLNALSGEGVHGMLFHLFILMYKFDLLSVGDSWYLQNELCKCHFSMI